MYSERNVGSHTSLGIAADGTVWVSYYDEGNHDLKVVSSFSRHCVIAPSYDGALDVGDSVAILTSLFGAGGPLPEPFRQCGPDPTDDALTCGSYPLCP